MFKPGVFDLTRGQLEQRLAEWGQPAYRARQIWAWLYQRLAGSFAEMTDLPLPLRLRLAEAWAVGRLAPEAVQQSADGSTRKWLLALPDGAQIESVLMEYARRRTVCISTQAGCALGCVFCATGQGGLVRNLSAGEIIEQVLYIARMLRAEPGEITNIVFMGMGEPFVNYDHFIQAAQQLNDPAGFNCGARRMTVSTVGVIPGIAKLAGEDLQINLAVSLHAATDELRDRLVPLNRRYPLRDLMAAIDDYIGRTHRRVSLEWAVIAGVNDTPEQAQALVERVRGKLCHVNLIPLNPTGGYAGAAAAQARVVAFQAVLEEAHVPVTLRQRRGLDIHAGCGQLRQAQHKS